MKKVKILSLIVVAILVLSLFAGCGNSGSTKKTSGSSKTEIIEIEEKEETESSSSAETVSEETNNTANSGQNNTTVSNTGSVYGTVLLSMLNNPVSKAINTYGSGYSYRTNSGRVFYSNLGLLFYLPEYPASPTGYETVVAIEAKGSFDIGNGFTASMTADQIRAVAGSIPQPEYFEINSTYVITVHRGGYTYIFNWESNYSNRPCDFVGIQK